MPIIASLSKFKKNNLIIYIVVLLLFSGWCAYDGYFNTDWIEGHTNEDGSPQPYLVFNKNAPIYLTPAAILIAAYLFAIRNRKIVADENGFVINDKKTIAYDSIQKIDKTNFKAKGYFIITHTTGDGKELDCKISDKSYDNLQAVLDHLIEKIT